MTFLGWRLLGDGDGGLARANVVRMRRRLRSLAAEYHAGRIGFGDVNAVVQAWLGHAAFGDTWRLREQLFGGFTLKLAEHGRNAAGRNIRVSEP